MLSIKRLTFAALAIAALLPATLSAQDASFASDWHRQHDRVWLGQDYWANPMEDWKLEDGRIECIRGGAGRSVHVLTRRLGEQKGTLEMSVEIERANDAKAAGSVGFEIGVSSELGDYRSSLLFGRGVRAGITTDGRFIVDGKIVDFDDPNFGFSFEQSPKMRLGVTLKPRTDGDYDLELHLSGVDGEKFKSAAGGKVAAARLNGNIALVHNYPNVNVTGPKGQALFAFSNWTMSGTKLTANEEHAFGPILYTMHTQSRGVMKMTAQMPPMGTEDDPQVFLQTKEDGSDEWVTSDGEMIDPQSRTATFRIEDWDTKHDIPYRLVYTMKDTEGKSTEHHYEGTVRKDPIAKEVITVAGFTGNTDPAFPNTLLAKNVLIHDPDVLFFSGDQIYEQVGGYGIHRKPDDVAILNYLRKIWLWGWAFRDCMRDRPTLVLPDDHDVYQGNIWGQGGRGVPGIAQHAQGGYAMSAEFVNAMQRTQTAHHPDAYDPTPVEQNIGVYYGDMVYGRVSFAVIEDRKFKSGPEGKVNSWKGRPDHVKPADFKDKPFDPASVDKPGLVLLGDRQLKFLDEWATDWRGADMKTVCSQTIFCNLANYHGGNQMYLIADLDSNGWPQAARNKALRSIRRGFAFHYAGDQHLPSIVHYGVDEFGDSGYGFCVPSIAAGYPRSWQPDAEGLKPVGGRLKGWLPNTGKYFEGLGNRVTVHAIGNPEENRRKPVLELLHDKSSGYGLVEFNKKNRTIKINCYKLLFDANNTSPEDQFPGWPKTIGMEENYGREAVAHLPTINVEGLENPVLQVINEADGEVVYTLRINGESYRPKVFAAGKYTVRVGSQETGSNMKAVKGLTAPSNEKISVEFP